MGNGCKPKDKAHVKKWHTKKCSKGCSPPKPSEVSEPTAGFDPCPVCKDDDEGEAPEYKLPCCDHKYHLDCLQQQIRIGFGDTWNQCGICRAAIFDQSANDSEVPTELREANTKRKAKATQDVEAVAVADREAALEAERVVDEADEAERERQRLQQQQPQNSADEWAIAERAADEADEEAERERQRQLQPSESFDSYSDTPDSSAENYEGPEHASPESSRAGGVRSFFRNAATAARNLVGM